MVVGEIAEPVDLLVVGGGPGGYTAAERAAELGRSVVLVEEEGREGGLGGSCLHVGCIPSKALIELAGGFARTKSLGPAGLTVTGAAVDLGAFQSWKASLISRLEGGVRGLLNRHNVTVLNGRLRFAALNRAVVSAEGGKAIFLEFKQAIIATGSSPAWPEALRPDGNRILSSTDVLALEELPPTLTVVGAGYIGLELGTAFAKLGSSVTVVELADKILPGVDTRLTGPVRRALDRHGVRVVLGTRVIGHDNEGLAVIGGEGESIIPGGRILVAVGRRPNSADLGLEQLGIAADAHGFIPVDAACLASPNVAAIGDVTAGPMLAHRASAQGRAAAESLCGLGSLFDDSIAIPSVIFTDPEIASVGLTEDQAKQMGIEVVVSESSARSNGRAATLDADDGFVQLVVDVEADCVVGVHIVTPHASELIGEGSLAVAMLARRDDIIGTVHAHPTLSEMLPAALTAVVPSPVSVGPSPVSPGV